MNTKNKIPVVSATDIGNACYCPHSLELRLAGKSETSASKANKNRGTFFHEVQNEHADQRAAEIRETTSDSRCYIATHLYGIDHPKTQRLRAFRDRILRKYAAGRLFIGIYYRISPMLIRICLRHPVINIAVSNQVAVCSYFVDKMANDE